MQIAIVVLLGVGILLIYAAVTGRSPQEIVATTFGAQNADRS